MIQLSAVGKIAIKQDELRALPERFVCIFSRDLGFTSTKKLFMVVFNLIFVPEGVGEETTLH